MDIERGRTDLESRTCGSIAINGDSHLSHAVLGFADVASFVSYNSHR